MSTAAASISWLGALGWLAAISVAGFLVTWVLTTRLGLRRTPYILALALLTGALTGATRPGATPASAASSPIAGAGAWSAPR